MTVRPRPARPPISTPNVSIPGALFPPMLPHFLKMITWRQRRVSPEGRIEHDAQRRVLRGDQRSRRSTPTQRGQRSVAATATWGENADACYGAGFAAGVALAQ